MSSTTANQAKPREYAFSTGTTSVSQDSGLWFVDSACTTHMTNELSDLSNVRGIVPIEVECGGGTTLKATQSGNVSIHTRDAAGNNIVVVLNDVLFVPKLGTRLFSVRKFTSSGANHRVSFSKSRSTLATRLRCCCKNKEISLRFLGPGVWPPVCRQSHGFGIGVWVTSIKRLSSGSWTATPISRSKRRLGTSVRTALRPSQCVRRSPNRPPGRRPGNWNSSIPMCGAKSILPHLAARSMRSFLWTTIPVSKGSTSWLASLRSRKSSSSTSQRSQHLKALRSSASAAIVEENTRVLV